nr:MAG TPA: hypothetical protein [Caudoviricetes sp.]
MHRPTKLKIGILVWKPNAYGIFCKKVDVSCLAFCLWWTSHLLCTKKGIVVKVTLECNF